MAIHKSVTELIGRTPLVELTGYEKKHNVPAQIVAKVENGQFILTRCGAGWGDPETGESIVVSPNDTRKLMDSLQVKHHETLLKSLGKRFALKEPHNSFVKIMTSLQRRGIPFERK